jgi:RND superfamily putative drug exporter
LVPGGGRVGDGVREELRAGRDVEQALVATMSTAGRTVAVSGVTVAVSLSSLLLFPQRHAPPVLYVAVIIPVLLLAGSPFLRARSHILLFRELE